jgi:hypothetical protein
MIAGALVNESDIERSVFTPDVPIPSERVSFDQYVFHSRLTQAISTEAEMMARYVKPDLDGVMSCIERIHVTGGTNGILVDALRRFRPFTPSFLGRAEDQAFILSAINSHDRRLAYFHAPGLIMRHDKKAFAQEAIAAASNGKAIGDFERIALFSAYARAIQSDVSRLKRILDPFTGCFVSSVPMTVIYLRFCLKVASMFALGQGDVLDFVVEGTRRLDKTISFAFEDDGALVKKLQEEKWGWELYYATLDRIETGLRAEDAFAIELRSKARELVETCALRGSP